MTIQVTRTSSGYRLTVHPHAGQPWTSPQPLAPSQVLQELTDRGFSFAEIKEAMDLADREAGAAGPVNQQPWAARYLEEAKRTEPLDGVTPVTPGWRSVGIGFTGDACDIGQGVNPWTVEWLSTYRRIVVAHPSYPRQRHVADVYRIEQTEPKPVFAAAELSNGVWGFWVPDPPGSRDIGRR